MILQANKQKAGQLRPLKLPAVGLWLWEVIAEHKLLRSQTFPLCGPASMQKVIKYSNILKVLRCGPVVYQRQVLCEQVKPVCKALTYYPKQHAVSLMSWLQSKQTIFSTPKKISFFLSISFSRLDFIQPVLSQAGDQMRFGFESTG